jgi:hypothetical protein
MNLYWSKKFCRIEPQPDRGLRHEDHPHEGEEGVDATDEGLVEV